MKSVNIYDRTIDEIRELMSQQMSSEDAERYRQMDEDSKGLLALNLLEMDCEEASDVEN